MKRRHLFEFEDQAWLPTGLRNCVTELLQHMLTEADLYGPALPKLREALSRVGARELVDLCSGAAGPTTQLGHRLAPAGEPPIAITLSDKYPNVAMFERARAAAGESLDFEREPVDASAVPDRLDGFRTLFTSFHHFEPERAKAILADAVAKQRPIAVLEFTERKLANVAKLLVGGVPLVWLQTAMMRPLRPSRLLWTYLVPAVPLIYCWDAIVSHLRTYTPAELQAFVDEVDADHSFEWEIGQMPSHAGFRLTYLIGIPRTAASGAAGQAA